MKSLLIFCFFFVFTVQAFETKPFKEFFELNQTKIEAFFDDFTTNAEEFLNTQRSSISIPLNNIVRCIEPNLIGDLRIFVTEVFAAFKNEKELSERKEEFCKSDIIEDISKCYDNAFTEDDGHFLNTLKSATFLPLHELCTYENPNEHFNFVESIESEKFSTDQIADLTRFDDIVNSKVNVTETDNCLPFRISTAYDEIINESDETFTPMTRGMFADAIQLYYSMKAKLEFKSFNDCTEVFSED